MKKENRVLGKVLLIILCTICLVWLIQKDKLEFQIRQPGGEGVSIREAQILVQAVMEKMDGEEFAEDYMVLRTWEEELVKAAQQNVNLSYGSYEKLLALFAEKEEKSRGFQVQEQVTYAKKYKADFYLLKEDWYLFYEELLSFYGLQDRIYKKEVDILAGKESLTGETIPENYLLLANGEAVPYQAEDFSQVLFSRVTAYVSADQETKQEVLLTVCKKGKQEFTLSNAWVMEIEEGTLQFFCNGYEVLCPVEKEAGEMVREMVSDLTFQSGSLKEVKQKKERVSGKLLRIDETEIELEGSGTYPLAEDRKIYQLYEELKEGTEKDLRIGYDFADFVLENGKVCGVLILRKENMESIRVAVRSNEFASLYHDSLTFQADCDMELVYGKYGDRKTEILPEGTVIELDRDSKYLAGDRAELNPVLQSGKIQVCSLSRNQGVPVYRGKMEIIRTENGLVLINEVLLEEYLYSVVPSEMPASYPEEALKAQAVCARTYAYQYLTNPGLASLGAHVDDSVGYQVYNNIAENSSSTKAVKETAGMLLFHEGEIVSTYYYSTSCGFGTDAGVWQEENKERMPYLSAGHIAAAGEETYGEGEQLKEKEAEAVFRKAEEMQKEEVFREYILNVHAEDFEKEEPWYRWQYEVEKLDVEQLWERLSARYQAAPDKVLTFTGETEKKSEMPADPDQYESREPEHFQKVFRISVLKRREGGVMDVLLLETEKGTYAVLSEYNIRYILSLGGEIIRQDGSKSRAGQLLPSAYFVIDTVKEQENVIGYNIFGGGYGHGVGMSQNAAKAMAKEGMDWKEILAFFYQNCEHKKLY